MPKNSMQQLNVIGLDEGGAQKLAGKLNELLASYQIFYMNVRGFHWNIRGESFFELHTKFEETYNDLLTKIDEIAERILTLGQQPHHTYSQYLNNSLVKEASNMHEGRECVKSILDSYRDVIKLQREILSAASEIDDEGTSSLMADYITAQEKTSWMLTSYLK